MLCKSAARRLVLCLQGADGLRLAWEKTDRLMSRSLSGGRRRLEKLRRSSRAPAQASAQAARG